MVGITLLVEIKMNSLNQVALHSVTLGIDTAAFVIKRQAEKRF